MGLFSKKNEDQVLNYKPKKEVKENNLNMASEMVVEFDENHVTHFFPHGYDETKQIADTLLRFKNVTVNLTDIERKEKKRLIDFLTGVMYALEGDYKKIDKGIYYFWISN
ncbi:cell division protein SepF [Spiroplasma monobiae]|uniref:Cell division protein SepF n=1 Tax=Spiroplasma monobiae MQ-1 TaxID=1336748 RepID=A0A2K9LUX7_SPISQ|nr:cell division protein SepF [Spiroplasma monobiae]AUM62849.1 hypothetical protein SMONO_v1c06000 [Spiroplasma monobiae MQ-1]